MKNTSLYNLNFNMSFLIESLRRIQRIDDNSNIPSYIKYGMLGIQSSRKILGICVIPIRNDKISI